MPKKTHSSLPARYCAASDRRCENSVHQPLAAQYVTSPAGLIASCVKKKFHISISTVPSIPYFQNKKQNKWSKPEFAFWR